MTRLSRFAIGVIACAIAAALSPGAAFAAFPGGNGLIAFSGKPGGSSGYWNIFTIRPDGSGMRQLTDSSNGDIPWEPGAMVPSWSSDGRRIVYAEIVGRYDPTGTPFSEVSLFILDADGGEPTQVVDIVTSTHARPRPSFSPSGGRILYADDGIRTIRPGGTNPRRLGPGGDPQYSPSGGRIVFAGVPEGKERSGIWDMRRDGSDLRRIAFARGEFVEGAGTYVMRADGSGQRRVPGSGSFPAFAPAGDRIAVPIRTVYDRFIFCSDLFTISPMGSGAQNLTNDCDPQTGFGREVASPSWQPDPPSAFAITDLDKNKRRGTAKLRLDVPGPGELALAKTGKVKAASARAAAEGNVTLPVKPKGKARERLRIEGRATVRAELTYTPDGAGPNTISKRIRLRKHG